MTRVIPGHAVVVTQNALIFPIAHPERAQRRGILLAHRIGDGAAHLFDERHGRDSGRPAPIRQRAGRRTAMCDTIENPEITMPAGDRGNSEPHGVRDAQGGQAV